MSRGEITVKLGEEKFISGTILKDLRIEKCKMLNGMTDLLSFHPDSALTPTHRSDYIHTTHINEWDYVINACYDKLTGILKVTGEGVGEVIFSFK